MVSDWVYESNLRPFLEAVSWLVGYGFDDLDWEAVTFGLQRADDRGSDEEWFDYKLGTVAVRVRGVFIVYVEVETPPELDRGVEVAAMVMQNYHWTPTATEGPPIKNLPYCPACGQDLLRRILVKGRSGVFLLCPECRRALASGADSIRPGDGLDRRRHIRARPGRRRNLLDRRPRVSRSRASQASPGF